VQVRPEFIEFAGGLDTVSPPLKIPPGFARDAQNYECDINGGYIRCYGYERFSGKAKPSDAAYATLAVVLSGTVVVGDVLTDNATTSFGTVIAIPSTTQVVVTLMTGHFSAGNIKVGGVVVGTCSAAEVTDGASTPLLHAQYKNLAADVYRALIAAVPGSGSILGVWLYNDVIYAFRNDGLGAAAMYKSTTSGWSLVALGRELRFSTGTAAVSEGQTLTGATSGATGVVTRISLESGTYGGSTAAGHFIFATITGTFQNGENLQVAGVTKAVAVGADAAISFAVPSGRFEFVNANFGGSPNTKRMYGCDGKNRGFEFDGTVFVPINTGMTTDRPEHVTAHKNQLFFSFVGSVQHCAPGTPYVWSAITGAAELAMGDTVAGFMPQPGGNTEAALAIYTRNNISVLYGTGVANWQLNPFNQQAGGYAYTIQQIFDTITFDDRGICAMTTTASYGNFQSDTLSKQIHTWLKTKRTLTTASCILRDKNQYRLFFSDKYAVYATFDNGKLVGILPQFFSHAVACACSEEMNDGTEVAFFGSTDGFVYQMEKGTSFDGSDIEAYLDLVFNFSGSSQVLKQYRRAVFEVSGTGYAEFVATYELGYGTTTIDQPGSTTIVAALSPTYWDVFTWDAFFWDGAALLPSEMDLAGSADNISIKIRSISDYYQPLKHSGVTLQYTPRRTLRANT
jgi:hypothetical protein